MGSIALWLWLAGVACGGGDVFWGPDGGPVFGLYHTPDTFVLSVHSPSFDPVLCRAGYTGAADFALCRAPNTGVVYVQRAWWFLDVADDGAATWHQYVRHTVLWFPSP